VSVARPLRGSGQLFQKFYGGPADRSAAGPRGCRPCNMPALSTTDTPRHGADTTGSRFAHASTVAYALAACVGACLPGSFAAQSPCCCSAGAGVGPGPADRASPETWCRGVTTSSYVRRVALSPFAVGPGCGSTSPCPTSPYAEAVDLTFDRVWFGTASARRRRRAERGRREVRASVPALLASLESTRFPIDYQADLPVHSKGLFSR